jgi:hypothetical protein
LLLYDSTHAVNLKPLQIDKQTTIKKQTNLVEEVMESNSTLKNPMEKSPSGLFCSNPQSFKNIMALVVFPLVEKGSCFFKATILLTIIFHVVISIRYAKGSGIFSSSVLFKYRRD